jgi:outer membrane protein, heavy metal efflux system
MGPEVVRRARWIGLAALLASSGCASTFAGPDLDRVRALTRVDALPNVVSADVIPTGGEDLRKLLEQPLDAEAAVRIAVLNNRELRARLREMGVARGRLVQAGLPPNPHLDVEKPVEPEVRYELGVEYDLTQAVLAPLRSRAAVPDLDAARYRAAAAVIELGAEVRTAFYDVQAAEQRLGIGRQSLDALAAGRDTARALADAGNIPQLALASQQAAYERTRALVAEVELDVFAAREGLQRLLGLHGADTTWTIRGSLSPAPEAPVALHKLETRALESSFALAETRSRLEALARRTALSRAEGWIPNVSVGIRAAELASGPDGHGGRRFGGGVSVSIPLFDREQGNTAALGAEFDALLERYHRSAVEVRSLAREHETRLTSAYARARQYETVIRPVQRRLTRETLLQFNAMQVGIFQLLLARREELDVELAYVETLRQYWTATARVEAVLKGGRPGADVSPSALPISTPSESQGGH